MKKIPLIFSIPLGIAAALALLLAFGLTGGLENRMYDGFLGWRPSPPEDKSLVLVQVDDPAVSAVGTWPISRAITADALLLLKEMGARYAVFDIEYVNKSPRGVNASVLEQEFPEQLSSTFQSLSENNTALVDALRTHRIPLSESPSFARQFSQLAEQKKQELSYSVKAIALDNDQRLAQTVRIFGEGFLTVHLLDDPDPTVNPEETKTAEKFALHPEGLGFLKDYAGFSPTIEPLLSAAKGLGFTNVSIDPDGVRRRIDLVRKTGTTAFPQLGFAAFLDLVGSPKIEVRPDAVILRGARYLDKTRDVVVPRAQDGSILINWPHEAYEKSFRHLSFYFLYQHDRLYADLVSNLEARATWGYLDGFQGEPLREQVRAVAHLRQALLDGKAPPEAVAELRSRRDALLKDVQGYFADRPEDALMNQVNAVLGQKGLTSEQRKEFQTIANDLPDWFAKTRGLIENLQKIRTEEGKLGGLTGAFCFLGNTNTGSTDLGQTPFQNGYPNLGTHASVVNMLLQRQFLSDVSPWWSWLLGLLGALAMTYGLQGKKPAVSLVVGGTISVLALAFLAVLFVTSGVYMPGIPLGTLMVLTFLGTTFFQFLRTEKEKGFLRNAFGRYLSNEVIQQIIANPDQLRLGGQQKVMTAMFTDIRGFSSISEKLSPEELVHLLNLYLTSMSDIILDLQGTIDKYEGDAIIAFFGAPLDFEDHARRACLAAVQMKRVEEKLNAQFLGEKLTPVPLYTRIGINTGPMVVGNMGTHRKMDYTIIGDAVNLAARLEGVNKLYGTGILISEQTNDLVSSALVTRRLDRVRVVGKEVAIRLFQVVEEKGHVSREAAQLLETYDLALDHFEARRWTQAREGFDECLRLVPDDGPSVRYQKLAAEYETTPPPATWDGVFKLETK